MVFFLLTIMEMAMNDVTESDFNPRVAMDFMLYDNGDVDVDNTLYDLVIVLLGSNNVFSMLLKWW